MTLMPRALLLAAPCALVACGPSPSRVDARGDACTPPAAATSSQLFFTATYDYLSGYLCSLDAPTQRIASNLVPSLSGDAVLGLHNDSVVVLNYATSGQDNATFVAASACGSPVTCQVSMHLDGEVGSADPRGYLQVDATRGYVTRFAQGSLAIVDSQQCLVTGTIDLTPYEGHATLPYARPITAANGLVWVALERLPPGLVNPTEPGGVVVIDPHTDRVVRSMDLARANPVGHFAQEGSRLWIACVGAYGSATDGAVVEIDTTGAVPARDLVTEAQVGGNLDAVIALDAQRLLLRVASVAVGTGLDVAQTELVEWSLVTNTATRTWLALPGYRLTEPVLGSDGRVYVGDRGDPVTGGRSGIRVFGNTGTELTPMPLDGGRPPYDLVWRAR